MKICISDKKKRDTFVSLFQVIKNCSSIVNASFQEDCLHIQGLDKSHVCLYNLDLHKTWFSSYNTTKPINLSFDTSSFYSIISIKNDSQDLIIETDDSNEDILQIFFDSKKGEFKKSFKLPLIDYDYQEMQIPEVEYDAEFSLSSKEITEMFSQLSNFGSDINIRCSEDQVSLTTNGVAGEMKVDILVDDMTSYGIVEDEIVDLTYSLVYVNKMCTTNKLSNEIDFSLSNQCPMKIHYHLGDDSSLVFFIAPKMDD